MLAYIPYMDPSWVIVQSFNAFAFTLWQSNVAGWKSPKSPKEIWRFLAGKLFEKSGRFQLRHVEEPEGIHILSFPILYISYCILLISSLDMVIVYGLPGKIAHLVRCKMSVLDRFVPSLIPSTLASHLCTLC